VRNPLIRISVFLVSFTVMLAACAALGVQSPRTFNERVAVAITTVTSARNTASTLLTAHKITQRDAENILEQTDNARAAIEIARQIEATDPSGADHRLTAILTGLNALTSYLEARQRGAP
jgi:hypothetical protein